MDVGTETVLASIRKEGDLDTRIRFVEVDDIKVVELRDFIPSLQEYGRGYWIPADKEVLSKVAQTLFAAAVEVD